jgi:hypothetical protein
VLNVIAAHLQARRGCGHLSGRLVSHMLVVPQVVLAAAQPLLKVINQMLGCRVCAVQVVVFSAVRLQGALHEAKQRVSEEDLLALNLGESYSQMLNLILQAFHLFTQSIFLACYQGTVPLVRK